MRVRVGLFVQFQLYSKLCSKLCNGVGHISRHNYRSLLLVYEIEEPAVLQLCSAAVQLDTHCLVRVNNSLFCSRWPKVIELYIMPLTLHVITPFIIKTYSSPYS